MDQPLLGPAFLFQELGQPGQVPEKARIHRFNPIRSFGSGIR
jgi:hypothetical protein